MKTKTSRVLRKSIASALVLLLAAAPMSPVADVFNISADTIVNAVVRTYDTAVLTDAPDGVVVYSDEQETPAGLQDGKPTLQKGYYIVSDKDLTFKSNEAVVAAYDVDAETNPYEGKFCYEVNKLYSESVTVTHNHAFQVKTSSKLEVKCLGETTDAQTVAELTILDRDYEYGDKIDIETKKYPVEAFGITTDDTTFGVLNFRDKTNPDVATTTMPTTLGNYTVEVGVEFAKDGNRYSLYKEFAINKKNVANLLNPSDDQAEKNDHIVFNLTPAVDGVSAANPTVTYDGREYTPEISIVNYVYDYNGTEYVETTLVRNVDYTAEIVPGTNAGDYFVTVTAVEESDKYTGSGTFKWNINTREFTALEVVDERESDVYDAEPVDDDEFTVSGLGEEANPGTEAGNTFAYKYYKLKEGVNPDVNDIDNIDAENFEEMAEGTKPTDAGIYRVGITVSNANYNSFTVFKNFTIESKAVIITPKADNNIVYGDYVKVNDLKYDYTGFLGDDVLDPDDVMLMVASGEDEEGIKIAVTEYDLLSAGTYDYYLFSADCSNSNYHLAVADNAVLTVAKKALTAEMFTVTYVDADDEEFEGPYVYNGAEQSVSVTAIDVVTVPIVPDTNEGPGVIDLIDDTDWEVADSSDTATNAGEYTVKVTAKESGNYTGTVELTDQKWTIDQKSINDASVTVTVTKPETFTGTTEEWLTYDGTVKDISGTDEDTEENKNKGKIVVTDNQTGTDVTLVAGTDYEIDTATEGASILQQTNADTYTFFVKAKADGNYKDSKSAVWTIKQAEATIKISGRRSFVYDGKTADTKFTAKVVEKDTTFDEVKFVWGTPDAQTAGAYNLLEEGKVPVNAGKYAVKATTEGNGNYKDSESAWFDFEITKRQVELYPHEEQKSEFGKNINIAYDVETAEEDTVTGLVAGDNVDFSRALVLDTGDMPYEGNIPVGFYPIVVDPAVNFANYTPVCDGSVDYEITKKQLTNDMFNLVLYRGDVQQSGSDTSFNSEQCRVDVQISDFGVSEGLNIEDVTITGTTVAYLPAEGGYKVTITAKDTSSFGGKVELPWNINTVDINAIVVIEGQEDEGSQASGGNYTRSYFYNGKTPDITIEAVNGGVIPAYTELTKTYWKVDVDPETEEETLTELTKAPVDAGIYIVQVVAKAKGYNITLENAGVAYFKINQRVIPVLIDQEDLEVYYNPNGEYSIPWEELDVDEVFDFANALNQIDDDDENGFYHWMINEWSYAVKKAGGYTKADKNKNAKVVGTVGIDTDNPYRGEDVEYPLDFTTLSVQFADGTTSSNYTFLPVYDSSKGNDYNEYLDIEPAALYDGEINFTGTQYMPYDEWYLYDYPEYYNITATVVPCPIRDNWIVFVDAQGNPMTEGVFDLYDFGATTATFKVYYNGEIDEDNLLVEGTDYDFLGNTVEGAASNTLQVSGKGCYTDFAEAAWTAEYNEEAKAADVALINQNVAVEITDVTAGLKNGQKKITVKMKATANAGYTITKVGVKYSVDGGETFNEMSRTGANNNAGVYTYTANIQTDGTIKVKAFATANNDKYITDVETDPAVNHNYNDLVKYTVTVNGGTFVTEYPEGGFTGTQVKTDKPVVKVKADPAEEGKKFYCWEKNGIVASYDTSYSFHMIEKNITLEAVYMEEEDVIEEEPVLNLTSEKGVTSSGKNAVQFVFEHVIPADYEIIEVGIIYGSNKQVGADTSIEGYQTANLTVDGATYGVNDVETVVKTMSNPNVKKLVAEYTNNNGKLTLAYGIGNSFDAYVNAIGYVTYRNDGQEGTLYSEFMATTYNKSV